MYFLFLSTALAGKPAYYHPDDIAAKSKVFTEAAQFSQKHFGEAQRTANTYSDALQQLSVGSLLVDDASVTSWTNQTRKSINGQLSVLQQHIDWTINQYDTHFRASVERGLKQVGAGKTVEECTSSAGMRPMARKKKCQGENLNQPLAQWIDGDKTLAKELITIHQKAWPNLTYEGKSQAVIAVTGQQNWINLSLVAAHFLKDVLQSHQDEYEASLEDLEEQLQAKDPKAIEQIKKHRQSYKMVMKKEGDRIRQAVEVAVKKARKKNKAWDSVGFCANPEVLGGCEGVDMTQDAIDFLSKYRKSQKILNKR